MSDDETLEEKTERLRTTLSSVMSHVGGYPDIAKPGCRLPFCCCQAPWKLCELKFKDQHE